jgi:pyruvate formate lyase activating enzyme
MKGKLFDIQRFSLNDGPGIRTVVFLKGCPLQCQWCHNPEGIAPRKELGFLRDKCSLCGECVKVCPQQAHSIINDEHHINYNRCKTCGKCVEVCPENALKLYGYEKTPDELIKLALKDKDYYDQSGGGITLSGGEPLMQQEFVQEVMVKAHESNIHVCLDTCGYGEPDKNKILYTLANLVHFDFKHQDSALHKKYTGKENQKILDNLKWIIAHKIPFILRCPVIPKVNDNISFAKAIFQLIEDASSLVRIDFLPYHQTGKYKYQVKKSENIKHFQKENAFRKFEELANAIPDKPDNISFH